MSDSLWPHGLQHARLPFLNCLPELTQTHLHWVSDAIQPSDPLLPASSLAFNLSSIRSFPVSQLFSSGGQSIGASASVLPVNIQSWFPLEWTGWISLLSKGFSRVFSRTTVGKHPFFSAQSLLSPLASVHDHWKNHSFDWTDLCWQSNVSAF